MRLRLRNLCGIRRHSRLLAVPLLATGSIAAAAQQGPAAIPAPIAIPAPSEQNDRSGFGFSAGADVSEGSHAFFVGGVHALNGDLSADGFLIRGGFTAGEYEEGSLAGISDVSFESVSVLVGYQRAVGPARVAFLVGPDFAHNGAGASPEVRGDSWGVRAVAEFYTPISPSLDVVGWGSYSTFENQYFVQGRILYRPSNRFRIGPEVSLLGGDTWQQYRLGARAVVPLSFGEVGLGAGHAWQDRTNDNEGLYASLILSIGF